MTDSNEHPFPEELDEIARRLRQERAEASDLELDRAKLRAMSRASRPPGRGRRGFRARAVSALVASGLLLLGAIGIGASSGGIPSVSFSTSKSSSSQYCPPTSGSGGKPKPRPNKCGKP